MMCKIAYENMPDNDLLFKPIQQSFPIFKHRQFLRHGSIPVLVMILGQIPCLPFFKHDRLVSKSAMMLV